MLDAEQRMRASRIAGAQKQSQSRMASKRAAAPSSQAKKRPALANLSNASNVPPVRVTKSKIGGILKEKSRLVQQEKNASSMNVTVIEDNGEANVLLDASTVSPPPSTIVPEIASLGRKTEQSLYISREEKEVGDVPVSDVVEDYKDIDNGVKDPQLCCIYAKDIYQHLRMSELKRRPTTNFMESLQQEVNPSMRGILVDWLVEVAEEYKLVPDTLYLTVSYIDRFLSANVVSRQRLQLVGVACMLIASKYEEISAPQVEEFCYITDNTYSKEELVAMERQVLNYLRFELTTPTIKTFTRRFMRAAQACYKTPSLQLEFLGNYLAELSLVEYSFLKYLPSVVAASAIFLARLTHDPTVRPWTATLRHYTGYKATDLAECVKDMYELQCNYKNSGLPAVREKYRQHKFKCVTDLPPPGALLAELFVDDL